MEVMLASFRTFYCRLVMMMILAVLSSVFSIVAGQFDAFHPNRTAVEGHRATLQCVLKHGVDLVGQTVSVRRNDSKAVVHSYQNEVDRPNYQAPEYIGRTTLDHEDLRRGVVTLHLFPVQLSDSGSYLVISNPTLFCYTDLHVVPKHQRNKTEGQEPSTVGPPGKDATRAGVSRNHDAAIAATAAAAVVICLLVISGIIRQFDAFHPNRTAVEGHRATLQCVLKHGVDLVGQTVNVGRNDSKAVVHSYQNEVDRPNYQAPEYIGRTTLDHKDLRRGVVTLHLFPVQLSDSGSYLVISNPTLFCYTDLHVGGRKNIIEDKRVTHHCEALRFPTADTTDEPKTDKTLVFYIEGTRPATVG
ncbi:uncharacterized protein V6R79_021759 [Siganus canaliculatus]